LNQSDLIFAQLRGLGPSDLVHGLDAFRVVFFFAVRVFLVDVFDLRTAGFRAFCFVNRCSVL
jgi:hypothetical protein